MLSSQDFTDTDPSRKLYDHLEKKAQIQLNRYLRQGTVVKKYVRISG